MVDSTTTPSPLPPLHRPPSPPSPSFPATHLADQIEAVAALAHIHEPQDAAGAGGAQHPLRLRLRRHQRQLLAGQAVVGELGEHLGAQLLPTAPVSCLEHHSKAASPDLRAGVREGSTGGAGARGGKQVSG